MSVPTAPSNPRATRRRWLFLVGVMIALVALAAVLYAVFAPSSKRPPAATDSGQPAATEVTTISGSVLRVPGDKPTALLFFSATCGECVQGGKNVVAAAHQSGSAASFLAVDMAPGETTADINTFLDAIGEPRLPAALDPGGTLTRTYGVTALTTVVVIDPAGQVVYQGVAPATAQIVDALSKAGAQ